MGKKSSDGSREGRVTLGGFGVLAKGKQEAPKLLLTTFFNSLSEAS